MMEGDDEVDAELQPTPVANTLSSGMTPPTFAPTSTTAPTREPPASTATTTSPPHTVSVESLRLTLDMAMTPPLPEARKERLIEFCMAFLGMSVFDLADVWVPTQTSSSDTANDTLRHVVTVSSSTEIAENPSLQYFQKCSETTLIPHWSGAVGRAFATGNPVWSSSEQVFADAGRAVAFAQAQFRTVLAVPVFGKRSGTLKPACVVSCYAFVKSGSVPFVLRFVQQALRLLWDGLDRVDLQATEHVTAGVWQNVAPADLGEMAADIEMQQHFQARTNKRKYRIRSGSVDESESQTAYGGSEDNNQGIIAEVPMAPPAVPMSQPPQVPEGFTWMPVPTAPPVATTTTTEAADTTNELSAQLSSIELPNGDIINIPLSLPASSSDNLNDDGNYDEIAVDDDSQAAALAASLPPSDSTYSTAVPQQVQVPMATLQSQVNQAVQSVAQVMHQQQLQQQQQHLHLNTNSSGTKRAHVVVMTAPPPLSTSPSSKSTSFHAPVPLAMPQALPNRIVAPPPSTMTAPTTTARTSTGATIQLQPLQTSLSPAPSPPPQQQQQQQQSYAAPAPLAPMTMLPNGFVLQSQQQQQMQQMQQQQQVQQQQQMQQQMQQQQQQLQEQQVIPMAVPSSAPAPAAPMPTPDFAGSSPVFCLPTDGAMFAPEGSNGLMNFDPTATFATPGAPTKVCRIQGCHDAAVSKRPYCLKHSGNRQCEHDGCTKCAQGSTRFCIAHGGGRRCTHPGCDKGARDKFFCAAHGGGKRCQFSGGCTKSAVGGSNLCTAHGGGRRCSIPGCGKSAQSSTRFCVKHGGGKKCAHGGCEKVARGRTHYCAAHGGGVRCKLDGCNRVAIGKLQLCRAHGGGSSRGSGSGGEQTPPPLQQQQQMAFIASGQGDPMAAAAAAAAAGYQAASASPEIADMAVMADMFGMPATI
uniref:WRKY19-like zinc finger domain-containing protein n=1 Tax=Entomoneis paludosa TaxID=265537 RepID=A0A6U3CZK2_9STRA